MEDGWAGYGYSYGWDEMGEEEKWERREDEKMRKRDSVLSTEDTVSKK